MSRRVLVTGGASFIGSHIVERLLARGDEVWILDDFSSGSLDNLVGTREHCTITKMDLRDAAETKVIIHSFRPEVVYHLAADHGGRGYVETQQLNCAYNFAIDSNVLQACRRGNVEKVIFASSGCIYPMHLQTDVSKLLYLREEDDGRDIGYQPDGLYGMAKLVGELTLAQLWKEAGIKGASCRFFTVYGPRAKENHAIIAMIARTFIGQDPFEVWGDGTQIRNWTYVDDIADGMVASEKLADEQGHAIVNLGTIERVSVLGAVSYICSLANEYNIAQWDLLSYRPKLKFLLDKPVGPLNRVADNSQMVGSLGLEPVPFKVGVAKTFDWYYETKDVNVIRKNLERLLIERK